MMSVPNMTMCLAWFRKDQWFVLQQKAADPEKIENTFEEWQANAEKMIMNVEKDGFNVIKVDVDVYELDKWCRANNVPLDGKARSNFAAEKGRDLYDNGFDL